MAYKQHFIEWFSGKQLPSYWTFRSIAGVTGAIEDSVDGGYKLSAGSATNDRGEISFNDVGQYDLENSVLITVNKSSTIANVNNFVGLFTVRIQNDDFGYFGNISSLSASKFSLNTYDGTTSSATASSSNMDTNWHINKLDFSSGDIKVHVDGVLEITKTTNRPTGNAQPEVWVNGQSSTATTHSIRYLEVYNK